MTVKENIGSVESSNYHIWATRFMRLVKESHGLNIRVLLIYDGYPSRTSLQLLEMFESNNIIV